jgi:hypothetical protein
VAADCCAADPQASDKAAAHPGARDARDNQRRLRKEFAMDKTMPHWFRIVDGQFSMGPFFCSAIDLFDWL